MRKTKPIHVHRQQRRVVGYVRISVDREQQSSTKTQAAAIEAYCQAHGWVLVDIIVDKGQSAYHKMRASRPGFRKAMSMITAGVADTFVVWKLDRCARNTLDLLQFVDELSEHDAQFVSVTENFDTTTPMGKAMLTIVAALAEMESAQKAERALIAHDERRGEGMVPPGRAPIGYLKLDRNCLELDPVRAPLVNEAADRVLAGESVNAVMRWMEAEGVKVSRPGLMTLLLSPTIAGLRSDLPLDVHNGIRLVPDHAVLTPGTWPAIVEPDKWHELRAVLRDPNRRTNTGVALRYPLVPLLRCGVCGGKMLRQNQKQRSARYICRGINDAPGTRCLNGITQREVDAAVSAAVLDELDDSTWRKLRSTGSLTGPDPAVIQELLDEAHARLRARDIGFDEYVSLKREWEAELAAAHQPRTNLPAVENVRAAWPSLSPQEQLLVFQRVIKSLVIAPSTRRGRGVDLDRVKMEFH